MQQREVRVCLRKNTTIAAMDFGTSKIACVIGSMQEGAPHPTGLGMAAYAGFRDSHWLDEDAMPDRVLEAVEAAQTQAGIRCKQFYVGIPGEFTRVYFRRSELTPSGTDGTVTQEDLDKLRAMATDFAALDEHRVVRIRPVAWRLDGRLLSAPPLGEKGNTLAGFVSIVTADGSFIRSVEALMACVELEVVGFVPSIVALGALAAPADGMTSGKEEERTSVVIDCGHFSTDIIVSQYGQVVDHKNIAEGGFHLTQDLAQVMRLSETEAEAAKKRCAVGIQPSGNGLLNLISGETSITIDARLAQEVLEARIDDIAARVKKELERFHVLLGDSIYVVLAGSGLGQVRGAKEYISQKLGSTVRNISQSVSQVSSPSMVTAVAILRLALAGRQGETPKGLQGFLRGIFKR